MLVGIKIFLNVVQIQLQIFTGIKKTEFYILNKYFPDSRPLWSTRSINMTCRRNPHSFFFIFLSVLLKDAVNFYDRTCFEEWWNVIVK
jgi:hypothetical protein